MIFLTSYIWDFDIYHLRGDDVRKPTLHLCGEYQASYESWGFYGTRRLSDGSYFFVRKSGIIEEQFAG